MATAYTYRPLRADKKQIRLLRIHPDRVRDDQPLECFLRTCTPTGLENSDGGIISAPTSHDRKDKLSRDSRSSLTLPSPTPKYFAISYAWGDATQRSQMIIDGVVVDVSESSEVALRYLSRHALGMKEAYFWIDAICINQADVAERSSQVALMKDVYSKAEQVLLWMGRDPDNIAEPAIKRIRAFLEEVRKGLGERWTDWSTIQKPETFYLISTAVSRFVLADTVRDFFNSSVFSRLWIVQELALTSRVVCYRDRHCIPLYEAGYVAVCMLPYVPAEQFHLMACISIIWSTSICFRARRGGVLLLMESLYLFEVLDPKDRIYALLGLMSWLTPSPDYTKSLQYIYTHAAWAVIKRTTCLSYVLRSTEKYRAALSPSKSITEESSFPSWVPRYDTAHEIITLPSRLREEQPGASDDCHAEINYSPRDSPTTLHVGGILLDVIQEVSLTLGKNASSAKWAEGISDMWQIARRAFLPKRSEQSAVQRAFALTVMCGRDQYGEPLDENDEQSFASHIAYVIMISACHPLPTDLLDGFCCNGSKAISTASVKLPLQSMIPDNRPLVSTSRGFCGMSAPESQKGDHVCILSGCDLPVILRPTGNAWTFVGLAWIYGVMNGEAIQQLRAEGRLEERWQTFSIV